MKIYKAALLLLLPLFACESGAYIPTEVKIPITQRCDVKLPDEPDYNLPKVSASSSLVDKVKAALADLELYKGHVSELEAAVKACQP